LPSICPYRRTDRMRNPIRGRRSRSVRNCWARLIKACGRRRRMSVLGCGLPSVMALGSPGGSIGSFNDTHPSPEGPAGILVSGADPGPSAQVSMPTRSRLLGVLSLSEQSALRGAGTGDSPAAAPQDIGEADRKHGTK